HLVDEARLAVRGLVPRVHRIEHAVRLVQHEDGRLRDGVQFRIGHHHRDLEDAVAVGNEARHLHVYPDQRGLVRSLCHRILNPSGCRLCHGAQPSTTSLSAHSFAVVFSAFVAAALLWRAWLGLRQSRHVARHREVVPAEFAAHIPLESHRKAADYTLEKQRVGLVETLVVDGALLLALTLGGGLAIVDAAAHRFLGEGHLRELATVYGVLAISTLASVPFDAWRTFVTEERFGFNRMTPLLFVGDLLKGALLALALGTPLLLAVFW